ncbi:MAG TPA: magnesium transporter, partial [Methylophilaceae bacterium]|nr:magnesium transporter [Methylophilaceae bacterium]
MKKENQRKESLGEVIDQILNLLGKHKLVDGLVDKQDIPKQKLIKNLVNKQNLNTLMRLLNDLHPADIADILESLPIDERLIVWDLVKSESDGEILVEVSDAVR